jgi:hypothetical protein
LSQKVKSNYTAFAVVNKAIKLRMTPPEIVVGNAFSNSRETLLPAYIWWSIHRCKNVARHNLLMIVTTAGRNSRRRRIEGGFSGRV